MRTRTTAAPALLVVGLLLTACGGGVEGSAAPGGAGGGTSPSAAAEEFNDADVTFVRGMKPHHEQAIEMAEVVLAAGPGPEVSALAERIRADQQPEIAQLEEMLGRFGTEAGGHSGGHGSDGHAGMLTDEQLDRLRAAKGADAERLFLELMIEHHQGAVEAAETQLADGRYAPALALAGKIRQSQTEEVEEMEQLLAQL